MNTFHLGLALIAALFGAYADNGQSARYTVEQQLGNDHVDPALATIETWRCVKRPSTQGGVLTKTIPLIRGIYRIYIASATSGGVVVHLTDIGARTPIAHTTASTRSHPIEFGLKTASL